MLRQTTTFRFTEESSRIEMQRSPKKYAIQTKIETSPRESRLQGQSTPFVLVNIIEREVHHNVGIEMQ